ncbi:unnamed protein product [Paramecium sonneborni]|uniref:Uncharacterized protein n=1 Tax=Paramecium sonneborni TaxID=65129 RepID=A0A8S1N443_9CILI|nr:unnamed protein product [Paramecium sonneborni]
MRKPSEDLKPFEQQNRHKHKLINDLKQTENANQFVGFYIRLEIQTQEINRMLDINLIQ